MTKRKAPAPTRPTRAKVIATASPGQRKQLAEQIQYFQQQQNNVQAAGAVLNALLRMVYPGYDAGRHVYDPTTGQVTVAR